MDVLRAAGEPTRLRILALLAREELAVLELCRVLDQSQPRVSRHLKLLAEAGLVERFPDGAWVFYRLTGGGRARASWSTEALARIDPADPVLPRDAERLAAVRAERAADGRRIFRPQRRRAGTRSARSMSPTPTSRPRSCEAAGPGPFQRLVDLGTGTGRMLTLLGPQAERGARPRPVAADAQHRPQPGGRGRAWSGCELRHGDIFATRLPDESADLVVVHQVLHYLADPAAAVSEAGAARRAPAAG